MNTTFSTERAVFAAVAFCLLAVFVPESHAQTNFTITTPGGAYNYTVDGPGVPSVLCPTFDLRAGNTYTITVDTASIHPVDFVTDTNGSPYTVNAYVGADQQTVYYALVTLIIPATNYPSTLYYICDFHGFVGQMNILPPLPDAPPQNLILSLTVNPTSVVMASTGTNTSYSLVPEFSSNLLSGVWLPVPVFTNTFSNGTNVTSFDRLEPICGSNVFLRISQRPPQ